MSWSYFRFFGAFTLLLGPALFVPDKIFPLSRFFGESAVLVAIELVGFGLAFQRTWYGRRLFNSRTLRVDQ